MPTVTTVRTDLRRGINSGAAFKIPCKVATTAAITLFGEQTIDGVACVAYDSVLVKNQADGTFNGIYWVATGAWIRRPDFDGYFDTRHGTLVWVNQGSTNALTLWRVSTSDISSSQGPLPDTTAIAFTEVELGGAAAPAAHGFFARRSTNQTSSAIIAFDTEVWDSDAIHGAGTATIPAGMAGVWSFESQFTVTNNDGEGSPVFVEVEMTLSGGTTLSYAIDVVGDQRTFYLSSGKRTFAVDDTITVKKSGGNWTSTVYVNVVGQTPFFSAIYHGAP